MTNINKHEEDTMPYDTVDRENIHAMVHEFYGIVLKDERLAPFFIKALGEDLNGGKWHEHLHTLDSFWLLMMTGISGYSGNPFPPHAFLGQLSVEDFDRWLELFKEVVNRFYVPEIADRFYQKGEVLALQFIDNLGLNDEDEDD